jgi:hypothetical protein
MGRSMDEDEGKRGKGGGTKGVADGREEEVKKAKKENNIPNYMESSP